MKHVEALPTEQARERIEQLESRQRELKKSVGRMDTMVKEAVSSINGITLERQKSVDQHNALGKEGRELLARQLIGRRVTVEIDNSQKSGTLRQIDRGFGLIECDHGDQRIVSTNELCLLWKDGATALQFLTELRNTSVTCTSHDDDRLPF